MEKAEANGAVRTDDVMEHLFVHVFFGQISGCKRHGGRAVQSEAKVLKGKCSGRLRSAGLKGAGVLAAAIKAAADASSVAHPSATFWILRVKTRAPGYPRRNQWPFCCSWSTKEAIPAGRATLWAIPRLWSTAWVLRTLWPLFAAQPVRNRTIHSSQNMTKVNFLLSCCVLVALMSCVIVQVDGQTFFQNGRYGKRSDASRLRGKLSPSQCQITSISSAFFCQITCL